MWAAAETQILSTECEIYLTVLIKSLEQDFPLWHRIFVLEVLRTLCADGPLLRFLWDTYDGLGTTKVVRDLAVVLARHVHSAMQVSVRPHIRQATSLRRVSNRARNQQGMHGED